MIQIPSLLLFSMLTLPGAPPIKAPNFDYVHWDSDRYRDPAIGYVDDGGCGAVGVWLTTLRRDPPMHKESPPDITFSPVDCDPRFGEVVQAKEGIIFIPTRAGGAHVLYALDVDGLSAALTPEFGLPNQGGDPHNAVWVFTTLDIGFDLWVSVRQASGKILSGVLEDLAPHPKMKVLLDAPTLSPTVPACLPCCGGALCCDPRPLCGGLGVTPPPPIPDPVTLSNAGDHCGPAPDGVPRSVYPFEGEEGHYASTRLTPPSWPFEVQEIGYTLVSGDYGPSCHSDLAHRVEVYVTSTNAPPNTPTPVTTIEVPAHTIDLPFRSVDHILEAPIVLAAGEHLHVAVQMTGAWPDVACLQNCRELPDAGRDYWSNAVAPPFDWRALGTFGIGGNLSVHATGRPLD